jgi:hypothetical protein
MCHKNKKIASKSLKGRGVNSGFGLIYSWFEEEQRIVLVSHTIKMKKTMRTGQGF